MNKTALIISREYLTRVKKKSFIIMTILGPLLMAALILIPTYVAQKTEKEMKVLVVDDNEFFINSFHDSSKTTFSYRSGNITDIKQEALIDGNFDAVLHILKSTATLKANIFYKEDPPISFKSTIEDQIDKMLFDKLLQDTFDIDPVKFEVFKNTARSNIVMIQTDEQGNEKENMSNINRMVGMIAGILIYMFIFMFASMVLRGVLEEKSSRIVEVLLSSVKPMELMMGKIIGVAMVGLTQFVAWIVLTVAIVFGFSAATPSLFNNADSAAITEQMTTSNQMMTSTTDLSALSNNDDMTQMLSVFANINFTEIILCFLFYFLFGYLLYSALYAGIGSAVDNETDSNQFILPVSIPLLIVMMLSFTIANSPNAALARWLSFIPFTSPVAMLIRLPSGVSLWELLLSMALLILTFICCVWIAAKIYRTGILMYGKKVTYKELFKWLKY
ncbi:MAG: ABC transporter permease [Bacteroidales bacterium]|jgi:ABC-2 type transport system permease protein|nr:ABC transporter permease [Bacteroidales bacterium]